MPALCLLFLVLGVFLGYMTGMEDTQRDFRDACIDTGLYQTNDLAITCDVTSHKINGKTFFVIKEQ